jgi:hypothetical protein
MSPAACNSERKLFQLPKHKNHLRQIINATSYSEAVSKRSASADKSFSGIGEFTFGRVGLKFDNFIAAISTLKKIH